MCAWPILWAYSLTVTLVRLGFYKMGRTVVVTSCLTFFVFAFCNSFQVESQLNLTCRFKPTSIPGLI